MDSTPVHQDQYIDNAIRAVQNKSNRQIPEIDFTLHTMEDGTQVSTQERVCKGELNAGRIMDGNRASSHKHTNRMSCVQMA